MDIKATMKTVFKVTTIVLAIIILWLGYILFVHDSRPKEIQLKETELNEKIKSTFPIGVAQKKQIKVADLYPYAWDYVCFLGWMEEGLKKLKPEDAASINGKTSHDYHFGDSQNGLAFYDKASRSLVTLELKKSITGYTSSVRQTWHEGDFECLTREDAYVEVLGQDSRYPDLNFYNKGASR